MKTKIIVIKKKILNLVKKNFKLNFLKKIKIQTKKIKTKKINKTTKIKKIKIIIYLIILIIIYNLMALY